MPPRFGIRYEMSISAADVGARVSVRRRLPDGGLGDVLGELESWTDGILAVRRRDGILVSVAADALVAGKVVPPRPLLARTHSAVSARDLEEVAALGWQGLETARLGGWLLRAAGGWTGRANSVLPLGDPGRPLDDAIEAVRAWYAGRGLPARFQIPLPDGAALDDHLAGLGWAAPDGTGSVRVLTGDVAAILVAAGPPRPDLPPVALHAVPTAGWLGTYRYRGGALPADALAVLANAAAPVFAELVLDGETVAVGRASVDRGWVGITAMETAPAARRRGLGRHVLAALIAHGRAAGARHAYLQVAADNAPALALYTALGLTPHHTYHYRLDAIADSTTAPARGRLDAIADSTTAPARGRLDAIADSTTAPARGRRDAADHADTRTPEG